MSGKRIVTIRSGNEEVRMEVTEEEYQWIGYNKLDRFFKVI
ncbi:hypothetical protein VSQ32_11485 [Lachnospiraceae bacterium KK002]